MHVLDASVPTISLSSSSALHRYVRCIGKERGDPPASGSFTNIVVGLPRCYYLVYDMDGYANATKPAAGRTGHGGSHSR